MKDTLTHVEHYYKMWHLAFCSLQGLPTKLMLEGDVFLKCTKVLTMTKACLSSLAER